MAAPPVDGASTTRKAPAVNNHTTTPVTLHTAREAADLLRVRTSWLERQAAARRIPFTMLGGSYRFSDDHLAQIIRMFEKVPGADLPHPARRRHPTTPQDRPAGAPGAADRLGALRPRPRRAPHHRPDTDLPDTGAA
jgi:excisionase family DNA binding protein